jgi:hypothetical protein
MQLLEIPYHDIEVSALATFALAFLGLHLWRLLKSEVLPKKCVFCGGSISPDEYAHHLEICGLKALASRDNISRRLC